MLLTACAMQAVILSREIAVPLRREHVDALRAYHSILSARTGSIEAARLAGIIPAIAEAAPRTTIAAAITIALMLVVS